MNIWVLLELSKVCTFCTFYVKLSQAEQEKVANGLVTTSFSKAARKSLYQVSSDKPVLDKNGMLNFYVRYDMAYIDISIVHGYDYNTYLQNRVFQRVLDYIHQPSFEKIKNNGCKFWNVKQVWKIPFDYRIYRFCSGSVLKPNYIFYSTTLSKVLEMQFSLQSLYITYTS